MLSVENSKIEHRKLILLARFSPHFTQNKLIPEIVANCIHNNVPPYLAENSQSKYCRSFRNLSKFPPLNLFLICSVSLSANKQGIKEYHCFLQTLLTMILNKCMIAKDKL